MILTLILVAISSSIAIHTNEYLEKKNINRLVAIISAASCAVVFYWGANFLFIDLPMKWKFTRGIIDDRARYEGYYLESVIYSSVKGTEDSLITTLDTLYSIGHLHYNKDAQSYLYDGYGCDENGNAHASWQSKNTYINIFDNKIYYTFEAALYNTFEQIAGHGILIFDSFGEGVNFGLGYFIDVNKESSRRNHRLYKISKQNLQCAELSELENRIDVEKYIKHHHIGIHKCDLKGNNKKVR